MQKICVAKSGRVSKSVKNSMGLVGNSRLEDNKVPTLRVPTE